MNLFKPIILLVILVAHASYCMAQGGDNYGSGLKLNLDDEGNKYVRFIIWNQVWARYTDNNPGTLINGEQSEQAVDIGARRLRMLAYAQISPRFLVLTHFGINNQTFTNGGAAGSSGTGGYGMGKKPGIFFHDAWAEYAVVPALNPHSKKLNTFSLYFGAGLHYWNGVSRMGSASTLNFLAIDAPVFNWPLIEFSDQFARQYGLYIKGRVSKLNYSVSLNKPFATNMEPAYHNYKGRIAVDNSGSTQLSVQGYFDYQFLDQENTTLPFRVGTYLGSKKILNIGAGFYHQGNGTRSVDANGGINKHPINLFGADVFADLPVGSAEKNMAITAYSVFYNFNFGPNYIRHTGIMNPASGFDPAIAAADLPIQGPGNARVLLGTGNIWYTQAGFLLPKISRENKVRLQPFVAYTYKDLEYLDEPGSYFDIGANILLNGHHAKITPQYSTRPLYYNRNNQYLKDGIKGEWLIQFQIYL